jgi:hypothetical protein
MPSEAEIEADKMCPHCRGTGQPNGIMSGPEPGLCPWCKGTGRAAPDAVYRAFPAARSEPVAWRVLGSAGKIHAAVSANPDVAEGWRGSGYTVEALYTSPVQTREDGIREAARRIEGYIIEEQPGDVKTVLARKMVKSILALLSQPEPKT